MVPMDPIASTRHPLLKRNQLWDEKKNLIHRWPIVVSAWVVVEFWGSVVADGIVDGAKTHKAKNGRSCFCSSPVVILRYTIPQKSQ